LRVVVADVPDPPPLPEVEDATTPDAVVLLIIPSPIPALEDVLLRIDACKDDVPGVEEVMEKDDVLLFVAGRDDVVVPLNEFIIDRDPNEAVMDREVLEEEEKAFKNRELVQDLQVDMKLCTYLLH